MRLEAGQVALVVAWWAPLEALRFVDIGTMGFVFFNCPNCFIGSGCQLPKQFLASLSHFDDLARELLRAPSEH